MSYKISRDYGIVVDEKDTFTIPITIKGHIPKAEESYVFTIRRVLQKHFRETTFGSIIFQQIVKGNELVPTVIDGVTEYGFFVIASTVEAEQIPAGDCVYDLALVKDGYEIELIPRKPFIVRGVNR